LTQQQVSAELKDIRNDLNDLIKQINALSAAAAAAPAPSPAPAPVAPAFNLAPWTTGLKNLLSSIQTQFSHLFPPATPTPSTPVPPPTQSSGKGSDFVVSSFNVLGSSHTKAGGEKPWMGPGPERVRNVASLLRQHHVDLVGFQEMQHDQAAEFKRVAPEYSVYSTTHGKGKNPDTENSIAWRKDKFQLVKGSTLDIPYFEGGIRHIPVVLLRDKKTGQQVYVINTHNPADTKKHHQQERYRDEATRREVALVNKLKATGIPVIVTGDMNETNEAYDHFHGEAGLQAAMTDSKGRLPKRTGIDWIFGTKGNVQFSHYGRDRGALEQKTSDHPMVYSNVHLG
jgi:endonuclease/exonuclease/phosphatase family metal-dependent hydrolase